MTNLEKLFNEHKFSTWSGQEFTIDMLECNKGWHDLIAGLMEELIALGWNKKICQIKEKFGGLRFYLDESDEKMENAIDAAEHKSYSICEFCGDVGALVHSRYWWRTTCAKCNELTFNHAP